MSESSFQHKIRKAFLILVFCLFFLAIGHTGLKVLLSKITELDTSSSVGEISDIILSYFSIIVTIMLSVFVYWQAERINKLEAAQYDVFLGAEKLDCSRSIGTELLLLNQSRVPSEVKVFETAVNNQFGLVANISLQEGKESLQLPFLFITRNTPLITALKIKQIDVIIKFYSNSKKDDYKKYFPVLVNPIYRFLSDKSEFILFFSINGIEKKNIEKVKIRVHFEVEDQLKRNHAIESEMEVEQRYSELCMISSRSYT